MRKCVRLSSWSLQHFLHFLDIDTKRVSDCILLHSLWSLSFFALLHWSCVTRSLNKTVLLDIFISLYHLEFFFYQNKPLLNVIGSVRTYYKKIGDLVDFWLADECRERERERGKKDDGHVLYQQMRSPLFREIFCTCVCRMSETGVCLKGNDFWRLHFLNARHLDAKVSAQCCANLR